MADFLLSSNLFHVFSNESTFLNHNGSSIVDHIVTIGSLADLVTDRAFIGTSVFRDHFPLHLELPFIDPSTRKYWNNVDWPAFNQHLYDLLQDDEAAAATFQHSIHLP